MNAASADRRRWLVAGCVSLGLFASALDTTVNVALPTIAEAFDTDLSSLQWVIIAFVTTNTALGVSMGSAGDRFGLARFFRLGLLIYAVAMLLLGLAPNLVVLVGLRVLQGVAAAAVVSVGPALVALAFSAGDRGRALGLVGSTQAFGSVAAGFAGGVLVEAFGWPVIFLARIPFLLVALLLAFVVLDDRRADDRRTGGRATGAPATFDLPGALALAVAVGSLLVGLNLLRATGVGTVPAVLLLFVTVAAAAIFVTVELRAPWPVLDLSLFRRRPFAAAFLTLLFNSLGSFVIFFIFPFFVADVLDRGAATLGFMLGVQGICGAGSAPVGGWLADRFPPQRLVTTASVIVAGAVLWISTLDASSTVVAATLPLALAGIGQGTLRTAARTLVFNSVPQDRFGTASGALNLGSSMGLVLSVAAFTAFFATRLDAHTAQLLAEGLSDAAAATSAHVEAFRETFRLGTLLVLVAVAASTLAWAPQRATRTPRAEGP
jgi:EmrB/QacA subfamily drug resistance transporter